MLFLRQITPEMLLTIGANLIGRQGIQKVDLFSEEALREIVALEAQVEQQQMINNRGL